jgi:hypothetical protein
MDGVVRKSQERFPELLVIPMRSEESAVCLQLIRCQQTADSSTAKRRFGMTNSDDKLQG